MKEGRDTPHRENENLKLAEGQGPKGQVCPGPSSNLLYM